MIHRKKREGGAWVVIGAMMAVLCVSSAATAQQHMKGLVNVTGDVVVLWGGEAGENTVVNKFTGEPADGSEIAAKIRPGVIRIVDADMVVLNEHNRNGKRMIQGQPGQLVANYEVMTADGERLLPSESLGAVSFLASGVVKNPGPEAVEVTMTANGAFETFTIAPGDGIFVGSEEDAVETAAGHGLGCACLCDTDGGVADGPFITTTCRDCDPEEPGVQGCCCASLNGTPCLIEVGPSLELGTAKNSFPALVPN